LIVDVEPLLITEPVVLVQNAEKTKVIGILTPNIYLKMQHLKAMPSTVQKVMSKEFMLVEESEVD